MKNPMPSSYRLTAFAAGIILSLMIAFSVGGDVADAQVARIGVTRAAVSSEDDLASLVDGNTEFAFDLYRQLVDSEEGNLIFSPYSISLAFAMLYAGANDETATQIAETMRYRLPQERLHPAFNALNLMFPPPPVQVPTPPTVTPSNFFVENPADDLTLAIANAIWIQQGFPVEETYLDSIAMNYGGGVNRVDFSQNPEDAYRTINQWIEQATIGHINDMPPRESISSGTRLALTNAVYFRGEWTFPFSESQTYESIFYTQDGNEVSIPIMVNDFAVAECVRGTDYHAIELTYGRSRNAAMLILLPDSGVFHQVESRLNPGFFQNVLSHLYLTNTLTYSMPRFEFESEIDLQSSLSAMGMTAPFGAGADFSGVSPNALFMDYVGHKATISVDEQGTEATGATTVAMALSVLPTPCGAEVTADRPFIFAIYDTRTRTILFLGRVMNPAA